jgi:hypothetical protein
MIKHVILWKLKEDLNDEEKASVCDNAKLALEGLWGQIPGLLSLRVEGGRLPTSNADLMLYSEFESIEALSAYQKNPIHVRVANHYVRPFVCQRLCFDFDDEE